MTVWSDPATALPAPYWDTSCPNWAERLMRGESLIPALPIVGKFREEAERALRIFRRLRIPDMVGQPAMGDVAGPWLFPIVEAVFGCYDVTTNRRMIQEFFWLVPKKNTKSSSSAAIMVEALILNRRPEGEFALIAPTKEIANIAFKQASGTIRADLELSKVFQIQEHLRTITHRKTGATLKVLAADTDVITGGKQVGTLIDELHVLADRPKAADILVEIRGAMAARPDGFLIIVTTQSKKPPVGVFRSELNNARAVRDGLFRAPLLPILYELPPDLVGKDVWRERRHWGIVNPNLGRSVDIGFLEREIARAEREGPAQLALIASQHFNVEIGLGLRSDAWPGASFWEAAGESLTLDDLLARADVVVVGIDGGGLDDLFALAAIGRDKTTRAWLCWSHAWVHRSVLELRKGIATALLDFERDGDLTIVDRMGQDIEDAVAIIGTIKASGLLAEENAVGLDPFGVGAVVDALAEIEIGEGRVVAVSQGYKLQGAIKTAERKLADGSLRHGGRQLMAWSVANARIEIKGNAVMITKQASGSAKIDPLMALFDACALMSMNPSPANPRSVYEDRGLMVL